MYTRSRSLYLCVLIVSSLPSILPIIVQDTGCRLPDSLLEGRRRIVSAVFRASSQESDNRASEARLNDDGWCSGQLATNIFDPYIEIDFGRDVLFTSVINEGVGSSFVRRYRVQVAAEDGRHKFVTPASINGSQPEPAIFPLGRSRISNANRHTESLPRPVIGQILRINPYEWNDDDHVCTKLEVFGCPLQECESESQLNSNQYVDNVTVNGGLPINTDNLFEFDNTNVLHCGPNDVGSFNITITYSSPVLLTEIGIHGHDRTFFRSNQFVTSFSLSFSEDDDNFTEYIRDTGSTEFTVSDTRQHYFALWPPITASSIKITINRWNNRPCMSLLMLGCNYSDVVDHSINVTNGTAGGTNSGLFDDMTVTLTTTEFMTTTTELVIVTATVTLQTATVIVTADLAHTPSPSPIQSSGAAASTSCSSDTDNTPIYVAVVIVIVGLLITIIVVIVGVLLCRRYQKSDGFSSSLNVKYKTAKNGLDADPTKVSIVEVDNDLYGKEELQPQSQSSPASPEDNEHTQIVLYDDMDVVKNEYDVMNTADNPQYGDTMKQSDATEPHENVYSYAIS